MESFPERVEVRKTAKSLDLELKNLTRSLAAKEKEYTLLQFLFFFFIFIFIFIMKYI